LRERIRKILDSGDFSAADLSRRIRILQMGVRPVNAESFQAISSALLSRRRLRIDHFRRAANETLSRDVSPQRLVFYRDNWYLDAWCHLRKGLRTFSVDAIAQAIVLSRRAREIKDTTLDDHLGAGFGIFSGRAAHTAVLRFSPMRARWVAREVWHPEQDGQFELDGAYVLKVPYSDPRELIMDVLKYGPDVEVLAPAALREQIRTLVSEVQGLYKA
jgi:predicted DNA-binding transcriptional regulator YafY